MASTKKQKGMVFHQEGATTLAAAPAGDHPPACLVIPKPGSASKDGMEQRTCVTNGETDMMGRPNMYPSKEASRTSIGFPALKHPTSSNQQSDNLSPDSTCKGIRVTLDNNSMWNEFFRCKTEMILTNQGSRMFPYCRFRITGLQPSRKYSLIMDIQPLDNSCYKWTGKSWQVAGKAECHVKSQPFAHPDSPSMGQHWMQNPVSFYKLKLTNSITDQEGNTILHSMHRYLPRLHVVQTDKAAKDIKLNGPSVVTFTFPQTEFMAVTAYQNSRFAQLKVDYNPFAKGLKEDSSCSWGLKLKLNSGKDLHIDGGTTNNEQHPLKKSLKSLIANHKPRSSKAAESKPSTSGDLQRSSTTNKEQSAAKVTEEYSCNSRPAQKLFSELIREAHVSLQRCNLEQLGINNITSHRTEPTNTKTTALESNGEDVSKRESISIKTHSKTSPLKKRETVVTKRKVKEDKDFLKSLNTDCSEINNVVAAPEVSQNSSVDSSQHRKPETQSEVKVKQHKRPTPLPLPALARFLKQHSMKSKKAKSKLDLSPLALPPETQSESRSSAACPPSDQADNASSCLKDVTGNVTKSDNHASRWMSAHCHADERIFNVNGQAVETAPQPSGPSCPDASAEPEKPRTDDFLTSVSVTERTGPEPEVPNDTPVLPNSDQPFCSLQTSVSITSSSLATSSPSLLLSPALDTVLPAPHSPQTPTFAESSALPSDSPSMKSDSLLPDPECSSFGFEPLSPASSPEPLPLLSSTLSLQLDSTTSEPATKAVPPAELPHSEDPAASVFKWHTVLPPPESFVDTSFTTFQPTPQIPPLVSVTSPLLPSKTHSHPEPQTFDTSTSVPPSDPAPPFSENEQSLPFPAELSPLALQLPLSPTFSSLDGDGLSPTPSIADLVHFFSTDDDLGMGVDFSNTEAVPVPCPNSSAVEANTHEVSHQVQAIPAEKPCKHKKSRRQKRAKTDVDQKMDDSTYTIMQPNLEEVEEQLFISFTSKEALKLHVVDLSEETDSQPQMMPEGHLQQTTDSPENDISMDVGESSIPDSINPNNFPAKLWRLVNNPANEAICWDSCGEAIIIDQHLFESQILSPSTVSSDNADAFKTTNFSSFVRQLNLYGFRKTDPAVRDNHHPTRDSSTFTHFYNPNFKRNHPELVATLRRLTVDNKAKLQAGLNVNCRRPRRYQRFHEDLNKREKNVKRGETAENLEEKISAFEKILLRDLKLMRHRQVIHPVLQEVGLKMNLLDLTLAIDLQYLGVCLPIPPPGVSVEPPTPELPPSQGICGAFVSRTGKTTDVTQIKGWREKFTPSEAPSAPAPAKPEAGSSSDLPKKNLSAFCSDMLDEYLENEGKLIDERAASFSQPPVEPVVYELPTRSTSYVRTLNSVLKKQTDSSPTSDLISGFIPPSKRPRLTLKETKTPRRENTMHKGPKHHKPRSEPAASTAVLSPADSNLVPDSLSPQPPTFKRRKKLKPKTSSQTLSPHRSTGPLPGVSEDMAPLESDSELGTSFSQRDETRRKVEGPVMTRTLLRQKDLEDGVVWEGRPRTTVTEERATIALTSLFTLMGFVSENPTAPIQLIRRRAPPCLNEFCRLGCVCSSLSHCSRISHCGRPACMLGCSCLKQKVVLLKNLDGSDSSPSHHGNLKKKKRKRRMKMAYILKEADSVSQPAERVRTLWKRGSGDSDPDPIRVPEPASLSRPPGRAEEHSSCARVRAYTGRKPLKHKQKEASKDPKCKRARLKPLKQRDLTLKEAKSNPCAPPPGSSVQPAPSDRPPSPPAEPPPKPSKRLIILAECKWESEADRSLVLKVLCERMSWDQLDEPFWIKNYLINPICQTVDESGSDDCVQYKIHISRPKLEREKAAAPERAAHPGKQRETEQQQNHMTQVFREDRQREVMEEEAEPLEDWQREVEEGDLEEEEGSTVEQLPDRRESSRQEVRSEKRKKMVGLALPFLTGISPAGFLSAHRKQPGGTDHLVQVNAKLYPLAKIQLGKMGALHPANRLAAYLTGRVGSSRRQQGSSSSSSSSPAPQTDSLASSVVSGPAPAAPPTTQPSITEFSRLPSSAGAQSAPVKVDQSAASSNQPAGEAPEEAGSQVITVKVVPGLTGGSSQVKVVSGASGSSAPSSGSVAPPVNPAPKGSQLLILQVPGLRGKVPGPAPAARPVPPPSGGQRMVLQMAPGGQYYRRPDGKLVQLIPIGPLTSVDPNPSAQRGLSSVLSAAPRHTPVITAVNQTPPVTTVTTSTPPTTSSSSSPPLSGLQCFSVPPQPSLLHPTSGAQAQKGTCTFKIFPTNSSKEPIIVTCAKVPTQSPPTGPVAPGTLAFLQPHPPITPMNLISLKPSTGRGAEPGVKTVAVSAVPGGLGGALVHQKPASPQTTTIIQSPAGTPHRFLSPLPALPWSEVAPVPPPNPPIERINPQPEPACDPLDLEIVCVDNDTELVAREMMGGAKQSLDALEPEKPPSNKTENSPDFRDQVVSEEEQGWIRNQQVEAQVRSAEETIRMMAAQSRLSRVLGNVDSEGTVSVRTSVDAHRVTGAFKALASVRNPRASPESLLRQAYQEIQSLRSETERLQSLKLCLNQQRDAFIRELSQRSGKSEQRILRKVQHLSSKQREMEKHRQPAPGQPSAAGGGADDITVTSSYLQQRAPQAPPTPVSGPPAQTPVQQSGRQSVLQVSRPRTIPNILSRRKTPAPPSSTLRKTVEESFQALVPAEVLSLVSTALPRQPVLTMSSMMAGQSVPQTSTPGVASVTLNVPSQTNQEIHVPSLPDPPTATNFNSLLQQVPAGPPPPPAPCPPVVSAGSDASSDQIKDQDQPPSQTDTTPEPPSSSSLPSTQALLSSPRPGLSAGLQTVATVGGQQQETRDLDHEGLTSLLNEIVFLNQQAVTMATTAGVPLTEKQSSEAGRQVGGRAHSPWLLHLDSDSDDTTEMEEVGLNDHTETTRSELHPGPAHGNTTGGVLTPPPLLQMKVGGVKVADPVSRDDAAGGGGGRREEGVAWRPMPRLVPLGLRGNQPS